MEYPKWSGSPEERIIREKRYAKGAGARGKKAGIIIEDLVNRELTKLVAEHTDHDIRFSRGWIVEDYGVNGSPGASTTNASSIETSPAPRLDIICYHGDVARKYHSRRPHALVPKSNVYSFIEVKKYVNPNLLANGRKNSESINHQLHRQREYINTLGLSIPQLLLGIEYYSGPEQQLRKEAVSDAVGLIECLNKKENHNAAEMANDGELMDVLDVLTPFPLKK